MPKRSAFSGCWLILIFFIIRLQKMRSANSWVSLFQKKILEIYCSKWLPGKLFFNTMIFIHCITTLCLLQEEEKGISVHKSYYPRHLKSAVFFFIFLM